MGWQESQGECPLHGHAPPAFLQPLVHISFSFKNPGLSYGVLATGNERMGCVYKRGVMFPLFTPLPTRSESIRSKDRGGLPLGSLVGFHFLLHLTPLCPLSPSSGGSLVWWK